jgi:cardiolipin synthase A/B
MELVGELTNLWHYPLATLTLVVSVIASGHALLFKKDSRSAVLWVGLIWLTPLVGAVLYFILGINRIRRRAVLLRSGLERWQSETGTNSNPIEALQSKLPACAEHLVDLAHVVDRVVERPLLSGNRIEPLINGDIAYPVMLDAIAHAQKSVTLSTYIFDRDEAGRAFAKALGEAKRRGVAVRVLIDATGTRYSWPSILRTLRREGVLYARFLPAFPLWRLMSMNLRSHRKILVIDGTIGFTGGMNIRVGHWLGKNPKSPVQDLHFRVHGPVVAHLQEAFADDWLFTTGEALRSELWFPSLEPSGQVVARGITDGPDEDYDKLRWTILGALAAARRTIRVVTPYFLPDPPIITALNLAAMRGVQVDIVLPARTNLPFVNWASRTLWWQMLERGCRVWVTPPPFDHTKIMTVDAAWSLVGSANWDPRSLRLNFEFNLECYGAALAESLDAIIESKLKMARRVTLEEVDGRSLLPRLRDGVARLFAPFL